MSVFLTIFIAMLASLGIALALLDLIRRMRAKQADFVCICFDEKLLDDALPDIVIICRTDAEQEEIIRRVCAKDPRRAYLKRL